MTNYSLVFILIASNVGLPAVGAVSYEDKAEAGRNQVVFCQVAGLGPRQWTGSRCSQQFYFLFFNITLHAVSSGSSMPENRHSKYSVTSFTSSASFPEVYVNELSEEQNR